MGKTLKKCDWCDSENVEQVGTEYNGMAILHCKDCSHEFYGEKDNREEESE